MVQVISQHGDYRFAMNELSRSGCAGCEYDNQEVSQATSQFGN